MRSTGMVEGVSPARVAREVWPGHGVGVMARFTLREALRKRILLGAVVITTLFVAIYAVGAYYGFNQIDHSAHTTALTRPIFRSFLMLSGLQATTFVASLLAIFISVGTISSEVDGHLLDAVLPKPIRRWELVLGKWIGFALMVAIYVAATAIAIIVITRLLGGFWASDIAAGAGVLVLSAILLMSLSLLGSSYLSTVTNGVVVTVLYSSAFIAGLMEQVGIFLQSTIMERLGIVVSLVVPSDALWRYAAAHLAASHTASFAGPGLFTSSQPPTFWMAVWAIGEVAVIVVLACLAFSGRDL